MHTKKGMRWVHGRHHEVRNPTAMESFYLTPYELFAGLGLLCACTWLRRLHQPVSRRNLEVRRIHRRRREV